MKASHWEPFNYNFPRKTHSQCSYNLEAIKHPISFCVKWVRWLSHYECGTGASRHRPILISCRLSPQIYCIAFVWLRKLSAAAAQHTVHCVSVFAWVCVCSVSQLEKPQHTIAKQSSPRLGESEKQLARSMELRSTHYQPIFVPLWVVHGRPSFNYITIIIQTISRYECVFFCKQGIANNTLQHVINNKWYNK